MGSNSYVKCRYQILLNGFMQRDAKIIRNSCDERRAAKTRMIRQGILEWGHFFFSKIYIMRSTSNGPNLVVRLPLKLPLTTPTLNTRYQHVEELPPAHHFRSCPSAHFSHGSRRHIMEGNQCPQFGPQRYYIPILHRKRPPQNRLLFCPTIQFQWPIRCRLHWSPTSPRF